MRGLFVLSMFAALTTGSATEASVHDSDDIEEIHLDHVAPVRRDVTEKPIVQRAWSKSSSISSALKPEVFDANAENTKVLEYMTAVQAVGVLADSLARRTSAMSDSLAPLNRAPDRVPSVIAELADIDEVIVCLEKRADFPLYNTTLNKPKQCFLGDVALKEMDARHQVNVQHYLAKRRMHRELKKRVRKLEEDEDEEEYLPRAAYGDFTVNQRLGQGGFKTVYKGLYQGVDVAIGVITTKDNKDADLKVLSARELTNIQREVDTQLLVREALINGKSLCRPFIAPLIAYHKKRSGSDVTHYYLIMALASGDCSGVTYANANAAVAVGLQLAYGVKCVQSVGYVHKDIKPLNTLRSSDGVFLWTNDFGLAAKLDDAGRLARNAGTRRYMPDETAAVSTTKYDIYALGLTFDELGLRNKLPENLVQSMVNKAEWDQRPLIDSVINDIVTFATKPLQDKVDEVEREVASFQKKLDAATAELKKTSDEHEKMLTTTRELSHPGLPETLARAERAARVLGEKVQMATEDLRRQEVLRDHADEGVAKMRIQVREAQVQLERAKELQRTATEAVARAREERHKAHDQLKREKSRPVFSGFFDALFCGGDRHKVSASEKDRLCQKALAVYDRARERVKSSKKDLAKSEEAVSESERTLTHASDTLRHAESNAGPLLRPFIEKVQKFAAELEALNREKELAEKEFAEAQLKKKALDEAVARVIVLEGNVRKAMESKTAAEENVRRATVSLTDVRAKVKDVVDRLKLVDAPDRIITALMNSNPIINELA